MGFYGKVINYLTKAFGKIRVNNKTIQATDYDDTLLMQGDHWIVLDAENKTVTFKHETPLNVTSNLYGQSQFSISKEDVSSNTGGSTITIDFPMFDERGHAVNQVAQKTISINVDTEIQNRINGDKQIQDQLNLLNRTASSIPNRYLSDVTQVNGLVIPVFQDLPFDMPQTVNLEYDEESGNLSFPTYFRTYLVTQTNEDE